MKFFKNKRRCLLILIDSAILACVYLFTLLIQFNMYGKLRLEPWGYLLNFLSFFVLIFASRFAFKIYSNVWRYANSWVFLKLVVADAVGGVSAVITTHFISDISTPLWMCISIVCMNNVATLVIRFCYQHRYKVLNETPKCQANNKIGVAIVGAGQVGALLAEELIYNHTSHYKPVCFIDRDKNKIGSIVLGLKVYGDDDSIIVRLKEMPVQEIFIALPEIDASSAKALFDFYGRSGCKVKIYDLPITEGGALGTNGKRVVREVRIEDLLFRDALKVVDGKAAAFYADKTILVTGGGGSIGSELCRQLARVMPRKLIIVDIYENNAYDIQQELIRAYGDSLDLAVEIASVRDVKRIDAIFAYYKPDIVFHAAAHKHVPLMEHSNCEAIKNNVLGTYNAANAAERNGVKNFILISTDKAVNPTNVMGASKRLCEMVVQCRTDSRTSFAAVRFGNVLGSNGSVIPLFKRQIEAGGPITVTDKRIIRYFMTIPEASGLVMQAGAMAKCGELFVLDMGKPVKIIDLAENMIKLSGYIPYRDIQIVETGLRPGEKLYEELLMKNERLDKTENNMIFIEKDTPLTREEVEKKLEILKEAVAAAEDELGATSIRDAMMSVVPTFRLPEEINKKAQESEEMRMCAN